MKILAVETSCDETAIAIIEVTGSLSEPVIRVLSNIVSSQVKLHAKFGGVVPNLARREHEKNLVPILMRALKESGLKNLKISTQGGFPPIRQAGASGRKIKNNLTQILERETELREKVIQDILPRAAPTIDSIAVTFGPGLAPALWVGVNFARALSYLWKKPLIPVNHMEGHIVSAMLHRIVKKQRQHNIFQVASCKFPALALLVSGGHTELVLMKKLGNYCIIGETLDDAAGEAFDKVARILGLGYPGGPEIAVAAAKDQNAKIKMKNDNAKLKIKLPRPMRDQKNFNFSFSGLKTAVLYLTRDLQKKYPLETIRSAIAQEFQDAVVEILVAKTLRAAKEYSVDTVFLGGGVAANKELRKVLQKQLQKELPRVSLHMPDTALTGDNALMIAVATALTGKKKAWRKVHADANVRLREMHFYSPESE